MTVTYHYKNLQSLADYYDNKAREERAELATRKPRDADRRRERATVYESVAYSLRNTKLEEL